MSNNTVRVSGLVVAFFFAITIVAGYLIHLSLGQDSLASWGAYLTGAGTIGLAAAAFFGGAMAVREYRERTKAEAIRWVGELFKMFFHDRHYRRMRQKIDYYDMKDVQNLIERNEANPKAEFDQEERDLFDEFTDYLAFFEFIAFLIRENRMALGDIGKTFDYYMKQLIQIEPRDLFMKFLETNNFENLRQLLKGYVKAAEEQKQTGVQSRFSQTRE